MLTTTFSYQSLHQVLFCMANRTCYHSQNLNPIQETDLRKRAKYLRKCKDALWSSWTREYLRGLRENHRLKHKGNSSYPSKWDVLIIRSDEKNRTQWKLGVVDDLITGCDGVVRGAKLRSSKSSLERPLQHFYPLKLSFDSTVETTTSGLVDTQVVRPQRDTAAAARLRIEDIATDD